MIGNEPKTRHLPPPGMSLVSHDEHQQLIEDGLEELHRERVRLLRELTETWQYKRFSGRRRRKVIADLAAVEQAAAGLRALDRRVLDEMRKVQQPDYGFYHMGPGIELQNQEEAHAHPS